MAIALDGSAHVNSLASSTPTIVLTTSTSGLVLISITTNSTVSGVSGGSLTWSKHAGDTTALGDVIELWSAASAGALSSVTFTITLAGIDYTTIDAWGVSGNDTGNLYDDNASVPTVGHPDPLAISTDLADTMIIGCYRMSTTSTPTQGTGFTKISGADYQLTEYKVVSSTQSALSVAIGTGATDANGGVVTAVRAAGGGGGGVTVKPLAALGVG